MGSSLNSFVTPRLATSFEGEGHYMNVAGPIFIGSILMSISLILAIGTNSLIKVLAYIDYKSEKRESMLLFESEAPSRSQI
jgi:hypothetical protein